MKKNCEILKNANYVNVVFEGFCCVLVVLKIRNRRCNWFMAQTCKFSSEIHFLIEIRLNMNKVGLVFFIKCEYFEELYQKFTMNYLIGLSELIKVYVFNVPPSKSIQLKVYKV